MKTFILSIIASSLLTGASFAQSNGPGNNLVGDIYLPVFECKTTEGKKVNLLVTEADLCLEKEGQGKGLVIVEEGFGPSAVDVRVSYEGRKTIATNSQLSFTVDASTWQGKLTFQGHEESNLDLDCDPMHIRMECL